MAESSYSAQEYHTLYPQPELDSPLTKGRFAGKVAIVTGGSIGIGRAVVERFSNDGASVAIFARDKDRGDEVARELQQMGRNVKFYQVDVADRGRCIEAVQKVADDNGGQIHYLVNNAGLCPLELCVDVSKVPVEGYERILSVNVVGVANMVQACFPFMKDVASSCSVVNIGSIDGHNAVRGISGFCMTKAAVTMMTKCMALDLSTTGIRVNCISPGYTWTPLMKQFVGSSPSDLQEVANKHHMNKQLIPSAGVASAVTFLCSKDAMFIDGADIPVDCGNLAMGPEGLGEKS